MKILTKLLVKGLGLKNYLKLVSGIFLILYKLEFLKGKHEFDNHYFVKYLIRPGDHIIDIGANLGYFTNIFAKNAGNEGKIYCVEPIELYIEILKANTKGFDNVEILPYALGKENDKEITMSVPQTEKYFSHGRTQISDDIQGQDAVKEFKATMYNPYNLFRDIEKLDYIKCDVEGHEVVVIEELKPIIEKFKPIIQIETGGENRAKIMELLTSLGYKAYYVDSTVLIPFNSPEQESLNDLFFITPEQKERIPEWAFLN